MAVSLHENHNNHPFAKMCCSKAAFRSYSIFLWFRRQKRFCDL